MSEELEDVIESLNNIELHQEPCTRKIRIVNEILARSRSETDYSWTEEENTEASYTLVPVESYTPEYRNVETKFQASVRSYSVKTIERVENPLLLAQCLLKMEQMRDQGRSANQMDLFHGTDTKNIDSICKNNLDWRLHGSAKGTKFGKGVSFSPNAFYASHYGDSVMFLVRVLVGNSALGDCGTEIPPYGYDSTKNGQGTVYVTYEDAQYYPQYLIHYGF